MPNRHSSPLGAFVRASSLHIGAAAATAALREELVAGHKLTSHDIDAAYAVSRVTPGTNLLALYAVLGHRLGGWPLAVKAVAVGAGIPAVFAVAVAFLYQHSQSPFVAALMTGARAGGIAVFIGAAVRLLKPQLSAHARVAPVLAGLVAVAAWFTDAPVFVLLAVAGLVGAVGLRPR